MKWSPIKRRDGTVDPYAIQSGELTICRKFVCGQMFHELWRGRDFQFCAEDVNEVKQYAELHENGGFPYEHENGG